jgi:hypothetical protein
MLCYKEFEGPAASASSTVSSTVTALAFPFFCPRSSSSSLLSPSVIGELDCLPFADDSGFILAFVVLGTRPGPGNSCDDPQFGNEEGFKRVTDGAAVVERLDIEGSETVGWGGWMPPASGVLIDDGCEEVSWLVVMSGELAL